MKIIIIVARFADAITSLFLLVAGTYFLFKREWYLGLAFITSHSIYQIPTALSKDVEKLNDK